MLHNFCWNRLSSCKCMFLYLTYCVLDPVHLFMRTLRRNSHMIGAFTSFQVHVIKKYSMHWSNKSEKKLKHPTFPLDTQKVKRFKTNENALFTKKFFIYDYVSWGLCHLLYKWNKLKVPLNNRKSDIGEKYRVSFSVSNVCLQLLCFQWQKLFSQI